MTKPERNNPHHIAQAAFIKRLRNGLAIDESLRWNQRDVINTTIDFLNAHNSQTVTEHDSKNGDEAKPITIKKGAANAALIESSPGSGKTRMMGFIAKQAAHLNGADPTHKATDVVKVLILTPRLDLNLQTLREFDEELGIKYKDTALYDSNQTQTEKNRAKSAPVLIATYQSLPAMLKDGTISLDPNSPQYRGLVEMDEVHELVNFKCKPKGSLDEVTIDAFVNNHQRTLLFTGTDDGVSERHFNGKVPTIYSKRLVKAHNQGLTCDPIHPGLVDVSVKGTDFDTKKNKERSKELVDYFGSHPKVIEAAVDAQLTADHPSLGSLNRYKSLFFVNGVDAGKDGKDYFNKKAKELKLVNPKTGDYLKAAHIHAKTPKAERKEIIKAYKKGEIGAIFNDSILTFGFDDREAVVIHNLKMHDRDTGARALAQMEQIFTRGTRICDGFKEKPALDGKPYGIDKQALLLTYRPIDSHGHPLNVLTSTDLLAGLTLPVKASREWQSRGENEDDPEKRQKLLSDDFEVHLHFDFDDQIAICEAMRKQYEQKYQQYPIKTADWLSSTDAMDMPNGNSKTLTGAVTEILALYDDECETGIQEVAYKGQTIRLQKCLSNTRLPVCIAREDWNKVTIAAGKGVINALPEKTDDWLSRDNTGAMPNGRAKPVKELVNNLFDQYDTEKGGLQEIECDGEKIRFQQMQAGATRSVCMAKGDWSKITKAVGYHVLQPKTDDWVDANGCKYMPNGNSTAVQATFSTLVAKYDEKKSGVQGIKHNDETIRVQQMLAGVQRPICVSRDDWDKVLKSSGKVASAITLPTKTDDWLSQADISEKPSSQTQAVKKIVGELFNQYDKEKSGVQKIKNNGQVIGIQQMKAESGGAIMCIAAQDWDNVTKAAGLGVVRVLPEKTDDWLSDGDTKGLPGGASQSVQRAMSDIIGGYNEEKSGIQRVEHKGKVFSVQQMQARGKRPVCIATKDWSKVIEIGKLPEKTDDWLSKQDLKELPIARKEPIKLAVGKLMEGYDEAEHGIQKIPLNGQLIRLQQMQSGSRIPICIAQEDWPKVIKAVEQGHTNGIKQKTIKPSDDHIRDRSGRSRSKIDE